MMKNLLLLFTFFGSTFQILSQDTIVLNHDDLRKPIKMVILSNSDEQIARLNTWFGINLSEDNLISFGGTSYYIPRKYLFNILYGTGARFDGTFFFSSRFKDYELTQSVVNEAVDRYTLKKYIVKIPSKKTQALGIHCGVGHNDFFKIDNISASHARLGLTLLLSKNGHWRLISKHDLKGGKRSTINIDGLWYFNHFRKYDINSTIYNSMAEFEEYNQNDFRHYGWSVTFEQYANFWTRKGHPGIKYSIGVGTAPFEKTNYLIQFGIGCNLSYL